MRRIALLPAACSLLLPALASAQQRSASPDPAAMALFENGRELIARGDWANGCEKMAQSMARYPAASTLMNLARCQEHDGKTATAWASYKRALVLNRETPGEERKKALEDIGTEGVNRLERTLPRLRVVLPNRPEGTRISESGKELPLDTAVPLDPGAHEITAEAPGYRTERRTAQLRQGETTDLEIRFVAETVESSGLPQPAPTSVDVRSAPVPEASRAAEGTVPTWAWISGGAGLILSGVAVGFAIDANSVANDLEAKCGAELYCDEDLSFDPTDDNNHKNRSIGIAIGSGALGVIALGASAIGIATRSAPVRTGNVSWCALPMASPRGAGLRLGGSFE